jgi:hypothetical protein
MLETYDAERALDLHGFFILSNMSVLLPFQEMKLWLIYLFYS